MVLSEGGDDDADHDVDRAEDGDGGTVVDAALPEMVMLARRRRGRDDEMHCLSCIVMVIVSYQVTCCVRNTLQGDPSPCRQVDSVPSQDNLQMRWN